MAQKKQAGTRDPFEVGDVHVRAVRGPREADEAWYWRAERYSGGDSETVWTGWRTRPEAIAEVARIVGTGTARATRTGSVRDLLVHWHGAIEQRSGLSAHTTAAYGRGAQILSDEIGTVAVEHLGRPQIEGLRDRMMRKRAARSVSLYMQILRIAWRWGRETGWAPDRDLPCVSVRLPELRRVDPDLDEAEALLGEAPPRWRLALRLLMATGCRIGEIVQLRWRDVTVKRGRTWITVTGKGRTRAIPLPADLSAELADGLADRPPEDVVCKARWLRDWIGKVRPGWTPHSFRRLAVRRLYRSGVDVGTASALLGHSPAVALRHYHRARESDLEQAVDLVTRTSTRTEG